MPQSLRQRLTYANVIATLALFIALGGGAYAATQLPRNSVGAKQIKKGAVTPAKFSPSARSTLKGDRGRWVHRVLAVSRVSQAATVLPSALHTSKSFSVT